MPNSPRAAPGGTRRRVLGAAIPVAGLLAGLFPALSSGLPDFPIKLDPPAIEMGAFYDGADVSIKGRVAREAKAVVVVRGGNVKEVFNKKARSAGIWVNAGKVEISGLPALFLCFSPAPISALLARHLVDQHQLDEAALKKQMKVEPARMDQDIIREHYLKLKRQDGTLQVAPGAVKMGEPTENGVPYSVQFRWPKKAPPAAYEVTVYECRDGAIIGQSSAPLKVVAIGFPAMLAYLARNYGWLYGVIAVLVASLAGFGMDFAASRLTKRRKRRFLEPLPEPATAEKAPATAAVDSGVARRAS